MFQKDNFAERLQDDVSQNKKRVKRLFSCPQKLIYRLFDRRPLKL